MRNTTRRIRTRHLASRLTRAGVLEESRQLRARARATFVLHAERIGNPFRQLYPLTDIRIENGYLEIGDARRTKRLRSSRAAFLGREVKRETALVLLHGHAHANARLRSAGTLQVCAITSSQSGSPLNAAVTVVLCRLRQQGMAPVCVQPLRLAPESASPHS